jgi:hypothetical protein
MRSVRDPLALGLGFNGCPLDDLPRGKKLEIEFVSLALLLL